MTSRIVQVRNLDFQDFRDMTCQVFPGTVTYIIQTGSKSEYLQEGALEIHYNICLVHNIKLEVG